MKKPARPRVIERLARVDTATKWRASSKTPRSLSGADVDRVLSSDRLTLHYQPVVSLHTGEVRRVEALLRWRSRNGLVHPSELIRAAEEQGRLSALARWVITTAVKQTAAWRASGLDLGVSINVAGPELRDEALIDHALGLIRESGLDPSRFTFEIAPAAFHAHAPELRLARERLGAAGARIALDAVMPADVPGRNQARDLDELKISRELVRRIGADPTAEHDARSLVELALDLRLATVAVGVEDVATRDLLAAMRCDLAQGHWLSRPLAASRVGPWKRWALGLAFGGTLALTAAVGAGKAAAGSSGGGQARVAQVVGQMPSCCTLDLPRAESAADPTLAMLTDRTGHEFVESRTDRAAVYLEGTITPDARARIVAAVTRDLTRVESAYLRQFTEAPTIYVFATRSSFALGLQQVFGVRGSDAGLLGAANGGVTLPRQNAIVLNLQNVGDTGDLGIVRHELTHAMVHQIAGPDAAIPAWLDEGLATLAERGAGIACDRGTAVTMTLVARGGVSLDQLDSGVHWIQRNAALGGQAYDVAADAARLLSDRLTQPGLIRALEATRSGTTFAQAYAAAAGESLADFERAFPARLATASHAPRFTHERAKDGVRWAVSGFGAGSDIEVAITGENYAVTYSGATDRYGTYSAAFGATAPPGEYTVHVRGLGAEVVGTFEVHG